MPAAEILTIGTELLLGEIVDTNTQYLARQLRDAGIDLFYTTTVGDNEGRIAEAVRHALSRSQILLCTGGLGPTVDDVTREGIARAFGLELDFKEELWEQIQERFARFRRTPSENNKRQAYLPRGAQALENAVGSAPGFLLEHGDGLVVAMPGVPNEMVYILEHGVLPYFESRFGKGAVIRTRVLHVAGVGESLIDERIADLERLRNPTVGLAAHAGSVDVRLTAKAESPQGADAMLAELEAQVRARLEDWIYGVDGETLAETILGELASRGLTLAVIEKGLEGTLINMLTGQGSAFVGGEMLQAEVATRPLTELASEYADNLPADLVLALELKPNLVSQALEINLIGRQRVHSFSLAYGGAGQHALDWAGNLALSVLRQELLKEKNSGRA
jgi:competence/damage-inducible protein CinA-like protein